MEAPDEAAEAGRQMARTIYMEQSKARNYPPPWRFENETDIPEDLALSHMVNMVADFRTSPQHLIILVSAMEWLSRTDAENLFAPKDLLGHMNHQWHPNHTQYLLDNDDKWYGKRKGDRKLFELPGRNHPCICGSNKKFKKCCMSRYPKTVTSKLFFNEAPLDHLCCPAMDYGGDSTVCKT
ncbi:MAG: SEC-C domain-containing protein [Deltaproteobacteria bacterium]|nr:SEC-C domain-containing protein [Deltaproteobacteria bacterium]